MNENDILDTMYKIVSVTCADVENLDLNAAYLCNQLGVSPKGRDWYEQLSPLYTENNGIEMHQETKQAFAIYVQNRLSDQYQQAEQNMRDRGIDVEALESKLQSML